MKVKVYVTLKNGVLDPQGKAVEGSLKGLGYDGVSDVRIGKFIELEVDGKSKEEVEGKVKDMSEKLLANTVVENYHIKVDG